MTARGLYTLFAAGLVAAVVTLALLGRLPLETDILAMLPATERSPVAEAAMAGMARTHERRLVLLASASESERARAGAAALAQALRGSNALQHVTLEVPPGALDAVLGAYVPHRFKLLSDPTRQALRQDLHEPLRQALYRALASPVPSLGAVPAGLDPFGTLNAYLAGLPFANTGFMPEGGVLVAREGGLTHVLVTAETRNSPHAARTQQAVVAALDQARQAVQREVPGVAVEATGLVLYAASAQATAKGEMSLIGGISLAGIGLVLLFAFRSLRPVALGVFCVAVGVAAGTGAVLLADGQLHLLTLVCGASLLGIAVDYPIHYFAKRLQAGQAWHAEAAMAAMRPALTFGLATSLLGYTALLFMPFPGLRQIALFCMAGLIAAYATTVIALPLFARRPSRVGAGWLSGLGPRFEAWGGWLRRQARPLGLAGLVLCLAGWWAIGHDDDIRLLSTPDPELARQEANIRNLARIGQGSRLFLVKARDEEGLLQLEERLTERLQARQGTDRGYAAVSGFVPSRQRQAENRRLLGQALFGPDAWGREVLDEVGYRPEVGLELERAFRADEGRFLDVRDWLAQPLSTPYRHLWLGATPEGHASVVALSGRWENAELLAAAQGLEGVTVLDKPAAVSALMGEYRRGMAWALAVALALAALMLARRHGLRGALATLAPSALAVALTLAVLGLLGAPLTLFHWLALVLVFGIGADYGIFVREGGHHGDVFPGVLLAAVTTLLSFGLLALSSTPALASFGLTLFIGIVTALLASPLASSVGERRPA